MTACLAGGTMTLLLRRTCAILVMLLTLTPLLAGAAEAGKAKPVA